MIYSMTGFGEAAGEFDGVNFTVEIKTVNNRYLKTKTKLPDSLAFLEEQIEKLLRQKLYRGTVNYKLSLKEAVSDAGFEINEPLLKKYVESLSRIVGEVGSETCRLDVGSLMTLPGIVEVILPDEDVVKEIVKAVMEISIRAIDNLQQMRKQEGKALVTDLQEHCRQMFEHVECIAERKSVLIPEYQAKLKKRIDELLASAKLNLDEESLAREVAIFADRSDISEEITRLRSHINQFVKMLKTGGKTGAGRKLDFIAQEMLREANTIASKASDSEIVNRVVDMKSIIDRLKEQVQNIE